MVQRRTAVFVLAFLLAGCASAPAGTQQTVSIDIENNLIPPGPVTIYLIPEAGIERMVGIVNSGRRNLQLRGLAPVGEHRLVARPSSGQNVVSSVLVMDNVTAIEWTLASNLLRITGTRER